MAWLLFRSPPCVLFVTQSLLVGKEFLDTLFFFFSFIFLFLFRSCRHEHALVARQLAAWRRFVFFPRFSCDGSRRPKALELTRFSRFRGRFCSGAEKAVSLEVPRHQTPRNHPRAPRSLPLVFQLHYSSTAQTRFKTFNTTPYTHTHNGRHASRTLLPLRPPHHGTPPLHSLCALTPHNTII
jgi:hypothetical protein